MSGKLKTTVLMAMMASTVTTSVATGETLSATVSVSDLDLTTPAGIQAARERLTKQALILCGKFSDSRRISNRETMADCVRHAVAEALKRLPHSH